MFKGLTFHFYWNKKLKLDYVWGGFFRWVYPIEPTGLFGYVPRCLNPAVPAHIAYRKSWTSGSEWRVYLAGGRAGQTLLLLICSMLALRAAVIICTPAIAS